MINFLSPIQYLLLIFLFFAITRVFLRTKDGSISQFAFIFWMSLFFIAGITVIDPTYSTYLATQLGTGRGVDAVVYLSVVALFYLVFRLHVYLENIRHEITKLVREIAILRQEKTPSSKKS